MRLSSRLDCRRCSTSPDRSLVGSLDAVGADFDPAAVNLGPLQVGVAAGLYGWVVVTAQKPASSRHNGAFAAVWTLGGHRIYIVAYSCYRGKSYDYRLSDRRPDLLGGYP